MKRTKHSLSNYQLLTCDMGKIIPLNWMEVLPGDSIQQSTSALIRCSPLNAPVMHPVRVRIHHFYVPNRLIWDQWEDFITGGPDGTNASYPPHFELSEIGEGTLFDYMGLPPGTYGQYHGISALPFRAYNLIYNEYYRDQDLVEEIPISLYSGLDEVTGNALLNCAWEKDYFTAARPWEQKGTEVTIPIGTEANVIGSGTAIPEFSVGGGTASYPIKNSGDDSILWQAGATTDAGGLAWDNPKLVADLSNATGVTVNDLRLALSIQRYQEARAQYGSRYVEYLRYLGVRSSDARLQNPEYLGGGRNTIQFSEVLRTGNDSADATKPVGEMLGHGIAAMRTNKYRRFFEEHGIVMTLMSVVPKSIYTSCIPKKFGREIKEDFFQKELQFIGEQPINNREIQAAHSEPTGVFGYQGRYDDYRSAQSHVSGEFQSTLNYWHYAREFSSDVALNQSFIDAVPTKRVNAAPTTHCLYVMANNSIQARRMIAKNPKPRTF